jgi:hypothetical protein
LHPASLHRGVVGIAAAAPFANQATAHPAAPSQAAAAPSTNSTAAPACLPRSAAPSSPCARPSRAPYASQTSALVSLLRQDAAVARYIMATQGSSPGGWVTRWVPVTHTGGGSGGFLDPRRVVGRVTGVSTLAGGGCVLLLPTGFLTYCHLYHRHCPSANIRRARASSQGQATMYFTKPTIQIKN